MDTLSKVYVGVDVSKDTLDIYLHPVGKAFQVKNSKTGIRCLIKSLAIHDVQQIVCESSGGYEELMLSMLKKAGYSPWQVDPRRVRGFAAAEAIKTKTDMVDAYVIALFALRIERTYDPIKCHPATEQLKELNKRKNALIGMATMEKNRLKNPLCLHTKSSVKTILKCIEKEILKINQKLEIIVRDNTELTKKSELLVSVPGIGKCTAVAVIAELPELGLLNDKKITALAGLAPYSRQSGTYKGKSFIRDGRSNVRSSLYMATMTATQHNVKIKNFYNRLIEDGKMPKVALIACMRKLLIIINAMLRDNASWCQS